MRQPCSRTCSGAGARSHVSHAAASARRSRRESRQSLAYSRRVKQTIRGCAQAGDLSPRGPLPTSHAKPYTGYIPMNKMRYIKPGSPTITGGEFRNVRKFKSLKVALKELEPFVRNGRHLQVGDEFEKFGGLRSREMWGNWLLCVAVNATVGDDRYTFTTDPEGGDGLIVNERSGTVLQTEQDRKSTRL